MAEVLATVMTELRLCLRSDMMVGLVISFKPLEKSGDMRVFILPVWVTSPIGKA